MRREGWREMKGMGWDGSMYRTQYRRCKLDAVSIWDDESTLDTVAISPGPILLKVDQLDYITPLERSPATASLSHNNEGCRSMMHGVSLACC